MATPSSPPQIRCAASKATLPMWLASSNPSAARSCWWATPTGGTVISLAADGNDNVKALVFVSGLAPDAGETASDLVGHFAGSTLAETLAPPVPQADGGKDIYIQESRYPAQFAADVPLREAVQMAATQRPIAEAALKSPWQDRRPGRHCRPGSSTARSTRTSRPPCMPSWRNGRTPGRRPRSRARRMS